MKHPHIIIALAAALGGGCLTPAPNDVDAGPPPLDAGPVMETTGSYMPWKVGNSWTYRVTENGVVSTKVTTVGDLETVGGDGPNKAVMANKVLTTKASNDKTVSWQGVSGDLVVRYREQSFHASTGLLEQDESWDPYKLHVDLGAAHVAAGATWLLVYQETKVPDVGTTSTATARDRWTVKAVDEIVVVPAGTFKSLVLQKAGSSTAKSYWFVQGIGKAKEDGGQTEELVSYTLQP